MSLRNPIRPGDHSSAAVEADITRELTEVGLSNKASWHSSAGLYTGAGTLILVAGFINPSSFPRGISVLAAFAVLVGLLCVAGARYLVDSMWAVHARMMLGVAIYLVGFVLMGDERIGFSMLPMITLVTSSFLFTARFALPYVVFVVGFVFGLILVSAGPARFAEATVAALTLVMVAVSLLLARRRTRSIAAENRMLAFSDPLTGIANTRHLRERVADELEAVRNTGQEFTLFAFDLDNFKQVNDRFDHSTGDAVLKAVASAVSELIGPNDLIARRGGDEFSVLVWLPTTEDADQFGFKIEDAIARARSAVCPEVTPSGSVAWVKPQGDDTVSSIMRRADDELHDAKSRFHELNGPSRRETSDPVEYDETIAVLHEREFGGESPVSAAATQRVRKFDRRRFAKADSVWLFASMVFAPIALLLVVAAGFGELQPLTPAAGVLIGTALALISVCCVVAALVRAPAGLLHLAFIAVSALVAVAALLAGEAGTALIDFFVAITFNAFFYFRARVAFAHFALYMGAFAALAIGEQYPSGELRAVLTVGVTLLMVGIVTKLRSVTVHFARINRQLAEIDALTGLANMRSFNATLRRTLDHNGGAAPTLIAIDLDRFKDVNDTFNHTTGDRMIEAVAHAISENVRQDDVVARRGGDEFFVLCPDATVGDLSALIRRLEEAIVHARRRICPDLTASASIATATWDGASADELMRNADVALHDTKSASRACGYEKHSVA